jgi:hypothetical protein
MLTGLNQIKNKVNETQNFSNENRIRRLVIQDGETAILRFLTDGDGVVLAYLHELEEMSVKGKKYVRKYCTKDTLGTCEYCTGGDKPKGFMYLWAYVYSILHAKQNPALDVDENAKRWQPLKVGSQTFYKEEVDAPLIFMTKVGRKNVYRNMITNYWSEYNNTLCDRDYKWSRVGAGLDTTYALTPKDPTKMSKEVAAIDVSSLIPLPDYITGKAFNNPVAVQAEGDVPSKDEPF